MRALFARVDVARVIVCLESRLQLEQVRTQEEVSADDDDHAEDVCGLVGVAEEDDRVVGLQDVRAEEGGDEVHGVCFGVWGLGVRDER